MGQSASITVAYGWVVDKWRGDWVTEELGELVGSDHFDYHDVNDGLLKDSGVDCIFDSFGYDFASLALLARASTFESYDWEHDLEKFELHKKSVNEGELKAELFESLEVLGWR